MNNLIVKQDLNLSALAEVYATSGMFKDITSKAKAAVKIIAGQELGIGPTTAMNEIHVIEGKTELGAGLIAARIRSSGKYDYRVVEKNETRCTIRILLKNEDGKWEPLGEETFTLDDAKRAGLYDRKGDMWKKWPRNMLFARAISNAYATHCPDIFSYRVYTPGEIDEAPEQQAKAAEFAGEEEELKLLPPTPEQAANTNAAAPPAPPPTSPPPPERPPAFFRFLKSMQEKKKAIGETEYYRVLATFGLTKSNQVNQEDTQTMNNVFLQMAMLEKQGENRPLPVPSDEWMNNQLRFQRENFARQNRSEEFDKLLETVMDEIFGDTGEVTEERCLEVIRRVYRSWREGLT